MRRSAALLLAALAAAPAVLAPSPAAAQGWGARLGLDRLERLRRPVVVWGELAVVEHRVTLGDDVEQATGPVPGIAAQASLAPWLDLRASVRGGRLGADGAPAEDRRMGELSLAAEAIPLSWIAVVGAASTRVYRTDFGRQRWTRLTIGPELRTPLHGRVAGRVRLAAAPYVAVSDTRAPTRALEGAAAVTYESARLRASLAYTLERYDFEPAQGSRRLEQVSGLTAALGWTLGR